MKMKMKLDHSRISANACMWFFCSWYDDRDILVIFMNETFYVKLPKVNDRSDNARTGI